MVRAINDECEIHAGRRRGPYPVVRCAHLDNRAVVMTFGVTSIFIDYVEYAPSLIVEGNSLDVREDSIYDRVKSLWDQLEAKMLAGIPPDKELSD